jgi:hypothetical protein
MKLLSAPLPNMSLRLRLGGGNGFVRSGLMLFVLLPLKKKKKQRKKKKKKKKKKRGEISGLRIRVENLNFPQKFLFASSRKWS